MSLVYSLDSYHCLFIYCLSITKDRPRCVFIVNDFDEISIMMLINCSNIYKALRTKGSSSYIEICPRYSDNNWKFKVSFFNFKRVQCNLGTWKTDDIILFKSVSNLESQSCQSFYSCCVTLFSFLPRLETKSYIRPKSYFSSPFHGPLQLLSID